jgi:hypothetical protein
VEQVVGEAVVVIEEQDFHAVFLAPPVGPVNGGGEYR